jgi:hypothetical protein
MSLRAAIVFAYWFRAGRMAAMRRMEVGVSRLVILPVASTWVKDPAARTQE